MSDVAVECPHVDVPESTSINVGPRTKRHTTKDSEDILFCYLWANRIAKSHHGGYSKYLCEKWSMTRPDKPLSKTALATKGKRLYDRASKDLGGKGWLGLAQLEEIMKKVDAECPMSEGTECEVDFNGSRPEISVDTPVSPESYMPSSEKPSCEEYRSVYERVSTIYLELKDVPVENQMRRRIGKKSYSVKKINWMDWLMFDLISSMEESERENISLINSAMYAVAAVMSFKEGDEFTVGDKVKVVKVEEPKWKRRLESRVALLRKEADVLRAHLDSRIVRKKATDFAGKVMKKYGLDGERRQVESMLFRIKNQISAIAAKIRRYQVQLKAKQQNELFNKDKKRFFRSIFEESSSISEPPKSEDIRKFWQEKIWGDADKYDGSAEWLEEVKKKYRGVREQEWSAVTEQDVAAQLSKTMNWKAAGIDGLSNFWLKSMPCAFGYIAKTVNGYIQHPEDMPEWVVKGRVTLLAKSNKTSDASQYRPIACLTTYWKCLSGILSDRILEHLNQNSMLAEEQQGAVRNSYGTKTQLLINKSILEDAIRKRRDLSMIYIDYMKAYDSVPHKWILEVLSIYKVSPVIINFLAVSMQKWKVDMFLYHEKGVICVENICIQRGIFQGDTLSPLLFIMALNPLSLLLNRRCQGYRLNDLHVTHILYMDDLKGYCNSYGSLKVMAEVIEQFTKDIGMEIGLPKCKVINLVRGKYCRLGDVVLNSGGVIKELESSEMYKYLGMEELDGTKHEVMKEKIWKNAKVKLRKLLETELNSRNIMQAINESVLPVISYSFGIINWLESDLKGMDVNIRKMLNMYKMLELKSDVDRLYIPRTGGGRGLTSVWDAFKSTTVRIAHVLLESDNELLSSCCNIDKKSLFSNITRAEKYVNEVSLIMSDSVKEKSLLQQAKLKAACMRKALSEKRFEAWKNKPQHGAFIRQLESGEADVKESLSWLNRCYLDPATESYVCAAQELALFTKYHEKHILKNSTDDKCRICKVGQETIFHILAGCDKLAKREYFVRHNNVCKYVHQKVLQAFGIDCSINWFTHKPRDVIMKKKIEVIYDQVITTDRPIACNRPDIIVKDIENKRIIVIDISCPCDINVRKKELEKIAKYGELKVELQKMWGMECEVLPVVVGGLGAVTKNLKDYLARIPGRPEQFMCQKITLLGSKKILRDVLARKER